ncbi:MAG: hypothetical protein SPI09_02155 [Candidatus Limivicinus sp.]|nr:hypothetical protein [Clostridiales bacterium]MDY6132152.1 hypothetical protein [Candidatus Limivicinus sp.]
MENKETFSYTYSARQQEEVKKIREKYLPAAEDKMEQLRRLDESAVRPGSTVAIILGTIGALLLGLGMCCTMVWGGSWFVPGVLIGVVGMLVMASAYPVFNRITKKRREKLAPEILKLTDELMK